MKHVKTSLLNHEILIFFVIADLQNQGRILRVSEFYISMLLSFLMNYFLGILKT